MTNSITKNSAIFIFILMLLATSCNIPEASDEKSEVTDSDSMEATVALENIYWKLIELNGESVNEKNTDKEIHLMLHSDQNRVTGFAGCNTYFGVYKLKESKLLRFEQLGSTRKACLNLAFYEQDLLNAYGLTEKYKINGNNLQLYTGDKMIAVFQANESSKKQE